MARVDLIDGAAAVQPLGARDWSGDIVNRPLTSGDRLWVDANSRAEVHLGSTALRLGQNTGLQFLGVGDRTAQLQLSTGTLNLRLRYLSPDESFEVDTPNSAITIAMAGEYRIDVSDDGGSVLVAVAQGQAEVSGQQQSFTLGGQQAGEFHGSDTLAVEFSDLPLADSFDEWVRGRDLREDESLTANYVSRDVTGYADLDASGTWQVDPDFGPVWQPQVVVGWAPYSVGRWAWVVPWGWTWIDAAPWGFAPFHYGRWVHLRTGWVWSPGGFAVRPVYAPALVAWVNDGAPGRVAWVPLGFNEIYRPSYRVTDDYLRRVNVTNTFLENTATIAARPVAERQHYVNQAVPGAVSTAPGESLNAAKAVHQPLLAARVIPPASTFARPIVARRMPQVPVAVQLTVAPHAPGRARTSTMAPATPPRSAPGSAARPPLQRNAPLPAAEVPAYRPAQLPPVERRAPVEPATAVERPSPQAESGTRAEPASRSAPAYYATPVPHPPVNAPRETPAPVEHPVKVEVPLKKEATAPEVPAKPRERNLPRQDR